MLHSEAVPPGTLALLKKLCAHAATEGFALVGGTSLALRFGHRISVDLDFFRPEKLGAISNRGVKKDFYDLHTLNGEEIVPAEVDDLPRGSARVVDGGGGGHPWNMFTSGMVDALVYEDGGKGGKGR